MAIYRGAACIPPPATIRTTRGVNVRCPGNYELQLMMRVRSCNPTFRGAWRAGAFFASPPLTASSNTSTPSTRQTRKSRMSLFLFQMFFSGTGQR